MSDPSGTETEQDLSLGEERDLPLSEGTLRLIEERRHEVVLRTDAALARLVKPDADQMARICIRFPEEWLAAYAGLALAELCHPEQLARFLKHMDWSRLLLLEKSMPRMAKIIQLLGGPSAATHFTGQFKSLVDTETDEWKRKGHQNVFELNRHSRGLPLKPLSPSPGQAERSDLHQQLIVENYQSGIVVPSRSLNGSLPGPSSELGPSSEPGRLIESGVCPVNGTVGSHRSPNGKHPNWIRVFALKRQYKTATGKRLTNNELNKQARYESTSCTEVKAYLRGDPRSDEAAARFEQVLQDYEARLTEMMSGVSQGLEAENARREPPTAQKS